VKRDVGEFGRAKEGYMRSRFGCVLVLVGALVSPSAGQEARKTADGAADRGAAGRAAVAAAQQQRDALQTLLFLRNSAVEVKNLKERVRVLLTGHGAGGRV
jgi:hypothetical protein